MSKSKTKAAPATSARGEPKTDKVLALLRRDGGASISEISEATKWLPHTVRAMLTGLRKKGFSLGKAKVEGTTRYSIAKEAAA